MSFRDDPTMVAVPTDEGVSLSTPPPARRCTVIFALLVGLCAGLSIVALSGRQRSLEVLFSGDGFPVAAGAGANDAATPPSPSRGPAAASGMDVPGCARAAAAFLNRTSWGYQPACHRLNGQGLPGVMNPLLSEQHLHGAFSAACPPGVAGKAWWHYYTTTSAADVCYAVLALEPDYARNVRATWGSLVPAAQLRIYGPAANADLGVTALPGIVGRPAGKHSMHVLAAALEEPAFAACKWLYLGDAHTWVNPRVVLHAVRDVAWDVAPVQLGYMWKDMGFTNGLTVAAGGTSLWSRAALNALRGKLITPECPLSEDMTGVAFDDITMGLCAIRQGIVPIALPFVDSSGALSLNGVPLEPGPNLAWLQQPHSRGMHWAWVCNLPLATLQAFWTAYTSVYTPLGALAPPGAWGGAANTPAAAPPPAAVPPPALPAGAPPCAVAATERLRSLSRTVLAGGASSSVVALPPDVVALELARACGPARADGAPAPAAAAEPVVDPAHVCLLVAQTDANDGGARARVVFTRTWGWHVAPGPGDDGREGAPRRAWLFGPADVPGEGGAAIKGLPDLAGVAAGRAGLTMLRAVVGSPDAAHCQWFALVEDSDWVNPRALAGLARGLRTDVPLAVGFFLPTGVPARGKLLLSALAAAMLVAPGACAPDAPPEPHGGPLGGCLATLGIAPIHTFNMDVLNLGPMVDWAFQNPHYLMSWALSIDETNPHATDVYGSEFNGLYGYCWNQTRWQPEFLEPFWPAFGYPRIPSTNPRRGAALPQDAAAAAGVGLAASLARTVRPGGGV